MATTAYTTLATDPLRNFKFQFNINKPDLPGIVQLGFMSVSGLSVNTPAINYREGGNNTTTRKFPGQSEFPPITCQRGVAVGSNQLWEWMLQIFAVLQGVAGTRAAPNNQAFRCGIDLFILDHPVTAGPLPIKASFHLYNAWPTAVQFSDVDAGGNAIFMQSMTLEYEGFTMDIESS
jgi:phage tail-like protein